MEERKKPAVIKTEDKEYTLEFSRRTVVNAQRSGFDALQLVDPHTMLYAVDDLFFYSFAMHHPEVTREDADKIIGEIGGISSELVERLSDLYAYGVESLYTENPKNATATVIL